MIAHAYSRLLAHQPMAGLLMVHQSEPIAPVIESLLTVWLASEAEEWAGVVAFLPL